MDINKRNRAELKSYFVRNAIPTENNFADLIDATLIQKNDGVAKPPGGPLSVEAAGDDTSDKPVLHLYRGFGDEGPAFSLTLNPRTNPDDPATAKPGLSVNDAQGQSRLFIAEGSGRVGVGTVDPTHEFHVRAGAAVGLFESRDSQAFLRISTSEGIGNRVELANRPGGRLALWVAGGGDSLNIVKSGRVGLGLTAPQRQLHVGNGGEISLLQGTSVSQPSTAGIYWHSDNHYAIRRTPGDWKDPNYQQIEVNWPTGIILDPGTRYGKSYVDARGKGLRVTQGDLVVGGLDPAGYKLRVHGAARIDGSVTATGGLSLGNTDRQAHIEHDGALYRLGGQVYLTVDDNFYIRDLKGANPFRFETNSGVLSLTEIRSSSHARIGQHIYVEGGMQVKGGVHFGSGDLSQHLEYDGAFYRYKGQVYITVDDNLYIRDHKGGAKFHFDTNLGVIRQDGWSGVSFLDGWQNYGGGYNTAGFYRDRQGVVHLRGLVKGGAIGDKKRIFILPSGYRPPGRELHVVCTSHHGWGRINVEPDGRVAPLNGNNAWISLDGISFRAI